MSRRDRQTMGVCLAVALALGVLQSGCRAAPSVDANDLVEVLKAIHRPVYDVYSMGADRDALHDFLANSFVGEALTREYVTHFTTLKRMEAEGTEVEILGVNYVQAEVLSGTPEPRVLAKWHVRGVVTHMGHAHARTNAYAAVFTLAHSDAGWRISQTRMKDLERLKVETDLDIEFARGREAAGAGGSSLMDLIEKGQGAPDSGESP